MAINAVSMPLLGILVLRSYLQENWDSSPTGVPALHLAAARKIGVRAFYFALGDVQRQPQRILGKTLDHSGQWIEAWFPWPQVLYLQGGYPRGRKERLAWFHLSRRTVRVNSQTILPKWLCYRALSAFPDCAVYLPETKRLISADAAIDLLQRHTSVYIKPDRGEEGKGISRITRLQDGVFGWTRSTEGMGQQTLSRGQLLSLLQRLAKQGDMVVQAEVPLFKMPDGRRADARALMQKDGNGTWVVDSIGLRIGKPGSIVTNCFLGAEFLWLEQSDERAGWSEQQRRRLQTDLSQISLLLVRRLEQALGPMGEIGLDLAFDGHGSIWMLEANSYPDKEDLTAEPKLTPQYIRVMEYVQYLARKLPVVEAK